MALKEVLKAALQPHKEKLNEWNEEDIELLFMGFGNISIYWTDETPREDNNLSVTVEVKRRGSSCLTARSQAEFYATQEGRGNCTRLIVTDGIRYGVFIQAPGGSFAATPKAYLNLTRLREDYPILECQGAPEALRIMAADWNTRHADTSLQ